MTAPLFIALPGNQAMADSLATQCSGEVGRLSVGAFPDGETHLCFEDELAGRNVILVCTLASPNEKIAPLLFAADAARRMGASRVGLVAPYLCYMRQDKSFHPGEAVTSRTFAALISRSFDWLATVDPHLHRYKSLSEIYSIPAVALHAGPAIAAWIRIHVKKPFLIGPDAESRQWVRTVADGCGASFAVLSKERLGDRSVRTQPADLRVPEGATPVLLDDIVSSGATMLAALRLVRSVGAMPPVLVGVHGILGDGSKPVVAAGLVTTNTIANPTAGIDVSGLIAAGIAPLANPQVQNR